MDIEQFFKVEAKAGKYVIDGEVAPVLELVKGKNYQFDLSDSSLSTHPFEFEVDGNTWDNTYSKTGTLGVDQILTFQVPLNSSGTISYYCERHPGMGSTISFLEPEKTSKSYDGSSTLEMSFTADLAGNLLQVSNIDGWSEYRDGDDLIIFSSDKTNYLKVIGAYADATRLDFIEYFFDGKSSGEIRSVSTISDAMTSGLHFVAGTFDNDTIDGASAGSLSATGYLGDDRITGTTGRDYLGGNQGNDTIIGLEGNDVLLGGEGDDTIEGGSGDDYLEGSIGVNRLEGGEGDDRYSYAYNGADTISDSGGNSDTLYLVTRDAKDTPYFGDAYVENDKLIFVSSKNSSHTLTIEDAFSAAGRIEKITFHAESGRWNDYTLRIATVDDNLDGSDISYWGTHSNDVIQMNGGYNEAYSSIGNDTILAGDGGSLISAGEGDDKIIGGLGVDYIVGDNLYTAKTGADLISAGGGDDVIYLSASEAYNYWLSAKNVSSNFQTGTQELINLNKFLRTEDVVDGGADADTLHLDTGNIALFLHDAFTAFHDEASLSKDSYGNESVQRIDNIESIHGYDGDNLIDLTSPDYSLAGQKIKISGGNGDDIIWGSDADENILGDAGNDVLFGGAGTNILTGGSGADEFQFTKTSTKDRVEDFSIGEGDTLKFFNKGGAIFDKSSAALENGNLTIKYGSNVQDQLTVYVGNDELTISEISDAIIIA